MRRLAAALAALSLSGCPNFDMLFNDCVASGRCGAIDGGTAGGGTAGAGGGGALAGGGGGTGGGAGGSTAGGGGTSGGMAQLELTPSQYPFGAVDAGVTPAPATFTVRNSGAATLTGLTAGLADGGQQFTMRASPACPGALDAGDTCTLQVDYAAALGSWSDTLVVNAVEAGTRQAALTATTPAPGPSISLMPPAVVFPYTSTTAPSAPVMVRVINSGMPLLTNISTGLGNSMDFSVDPSGCVGMALQSGQECSISLRFTPRTEMTNMMTTLTVIANGGAAMQAATLRGDSFVPRTLTLAPQDAGWAMFVSPGDGGRCPPSCTLSLPPDASVELTAEATAPGFGFAGWDGGCTPTDAGDLGNCLVRVGADQTVQALYGPANFIFIGGAFALDGGQRQADGICYGLVRHGLGQALFDGGGVMALLPGAQDPFARLGTARGWVRPYDGGVVVDTVADLKAGRLTRLIREASGTSPSVVYLGIRSDGGTWAQTCGLFTQVTGNGDGFEPLFYGADMYENPLFGSVPCGTGAAFYCLDVRRRVRVPKPRPVPGSYFVFLSRTNVTGGSLTANTICRDEAADAGLPRAASYLAFRSGSQSGLSLVTTDVPRYRTDGVLVATDRVSMASGLLEPVNVYADGTPDFVPHPVSTGQIPNNTSPAASSCQDWALNTGTATVGASLKAGNKGFSDLSGVSCMTQMRLYCIDP